MMLNRTPLIGLTFVNAKRRFIPPGHGALISLLLATLLGVSSARPAATAGNHAVAAGRVAVEDPTGTGSGARDGGGHVNQLFPRIERTRPRAALFDLPAASAATAGVMLPYSGSGRGTNTPSFTLTSIEGRTVRLSDYRGKVVLINFWATWCPPCRAEMPDLVRLQREYGKDGLQIIGVTYPPEQRARVLRFAREMKVNYPILLGTRETKTEFSRDETLPLTVIIDREGTLRGAIAGMLLPEEFNAQIKPLLERRASERETNHVQKNK